MKQRKWIEQWARVKRWFSLFEETNAGRTHIRESDYYQDEVYAFFQNCYHLKDWLKNSRAVSSDDVEGFVKGSESLRICGDLCNGSKHLQIIRPRESSDISIGKRQFSVSLGNSVDTAISVKYEITTGGTTYDAFTVAEACMSDWRGYLKSRGLI